MLSGHIQEINIKKYRGIQKLQLKNLNDINILVGDNNSGKTSVLEVISSLDNPHNIGTWARLIRENFNGLKRKLFFDGFFNMFPVDEDEKYISYQYIDKNGKATDVMLTATLEETQIPEREMFRINGLMETEHKKEEDAMIDTRCMHLGISVNGKEVGRYELYDFQNRISMFVENKKSFVRTVYVSPNDHALGNLHLNNVLADSELYEEMLAILKKFDKDIIHINAVQVNNSAVPEYMVLTQNHKRALPLKVYGDGMKKAILLLSAVVEAKDGILLLDEFETAIHTSAMDSIFSWILESAKKLNVQVFLTSHSKEAIDKVLRCNKSLQSAINVYTLYKKDNQNLVRTMDCFEAIRTQENLGLELR